METRLIIAYLLIALLAVAAGIFARHVILARRERRRLLRGHGARSRASARR